MLFAYRATEQSWTGESPFFLLYGRDPRLPIPEMLSPKKTQLLMDLKEYGIELHAKMSQAWDLARQSVGRSQKRQKSVYDKQARDPPTPRLGKEREFSWTSHPSRLGRRENSPGLSMVLTNSWRCRPIPPR